MTDPTQDDPRQMDDAQLAEVPDPPQPSDPDPGQGPVVEDDYAEGSTNAPDGAERPEPAGEDYAGSGF
ncbi:hypothetical protein [Microlunatus flavus]|uniref:Uncharacterized protein n=1 Tax=Microlunatus flavus TaxID=1036181 RepID=A0A1H9CK89_9ACTN|nr:hypothetical protein [Microlunatus flavus]SEQ01579.1 hypothetical protein SAMN05421756_102239 [Microlunatus flavus]